MLSIVEAFIGFFSRIDNYVGEWADPYGRRLCITKVNTTTASVSLFAEHQPLARSWYENRPSPESECSTNR